MSNLTEIERYAFELKSIINYYRYSEIYYKCWEDLCEVEDSMLELKSIGYFYDKESSDVFPENE
jgi:hypothetical protein